MIAVEEEVWCEFYGGVHDLTDDDPHAEGPVRWQPIDSENWTHKESDAVWGGPLWHFTCPGPHYKLWKGAQL